MSGSHPRLHQSAAPAPNALSTDKDAEMPATEKDLAEDAPWKKIQQNTFTRWCNEHLKCVNKRIGNLQTDLSDGLRLIGLLEVLSQKKMFRKYNQRPTFRQMQLENVSVALEFLDKENIKLVSIGESFPAHRETRLSYEWASVRFGARLPQTHPHLHSGGFPSSIQVAFPPLRCRLCVPVRFAWENQLKRCSASDTAHV